MNNSFYNKAESELCLYGYPIPKQLQLDRHIHRFGPDKALWYIGGDQWLVAGDWRSELQRVECTAYGHILSEEQRAEIKAKIEEERKKYEEEQEGAATKAVEWWNKYALIGQSAYLKRKQVKDYGVRFGHSSHYNCSFIAIPLFDKFGKLWSLQRVYDEKVLRDGTDDKTFLKKGRKRGCFHTLGDISKGNTLIFCEGYATGASLHQATGYTVIICFDAGNLEPVIASLRPDYPQHTFIIAGDDDRWKKKNTGRTEAENAAKKHGCKVAFPVFQDLSNKPTDFNDLHAQEGVEAVRMQVEKALSRTKLRALSVAELLTMEIVKPSMILNPIIPYKGLCMLYAARGIGKTFLSLSMAYAIASGISMLEGRWNAPGARKVLLVDGEMPLFTLQERMLKMIPAEADKGLLGRNLRLLSQDDQEFGIPDLVTPKGQALLEEHLDGVELVIFDNISSLFRSYKENDADSWSPIQEWLLYLRRLNISVLLVHHANKGGDQRGTSRKEDVLDTSIMLKLPQGYSPEEGVNFEVHYTKHRHFFGDEARPFSAQVSKRCKWTAGRACMASRARNGQGAANDFTATRRG